jgi:hypothetical protein
MDPRDVPATDGRPETLLAATILLMSAYAGDGGGPRLAGAVLRHLELLAQRADLPGVLAATCDHAADRWIQLARPVPAGDAGAPSVRRRSLPALLRLVSG